MKFFHQVILLMLLLLPSQMMGQGADSLVSIKDSTHTKYICYSPCRTRSFPGGTKGLMTWLSENVVYPAELEKEHIEGKAVVSFMIKPDGTPCNPEILSSSHPLFSQEALRIISIMPKWTSDNSYGPDDDSWQDEKYTIPITFQLATEMDATHSLNLGELFNEKIDDKQGILLPYNQLTKSVDVLYNGIHYTLGLSDNNTIEYISTTDFRFSVNGLKVGDVITKTETIPGWGNFAKINEEWYAAWMPRSFDSDKEEKQGKIQWFFKFAF